jgi:hypothetical protein
MVTATLVRGTRSTTPALTLKIGAVWIIGSFVFNSDGHIMDMILKTEEYVYNVNILGYNIKLSITAAALSKPSTVFTRSNTGIMGSNPI